MRDQLSDKTDRARKLRKRSTTGEQTAWATLRKLRAFGFPVRRQHPIDAMIVDFAIIKAKLVIEIDGSIHSQEHIRQRDNQRDEKLDQAGWKVIRIPNDEAFHSDHLFHLIANELGIHS